MYWISWKVSWNVVLYVHNALFMVLVYRVVCVGLNSAFQSQGQHGCTEAIVCQGASWQRDCGFSWLPSILCPEHTNHRQPCQPIPPVSAQPHCSLLQPTTDKFGILASSTKLPADCDAVHRVACELDHCTATTRIKIPPQSQPVLSLCHMTGMDALVSANTLVTELCYLKTHPDRPIRKWVKTTRRLVLQH